jgi:hypothetical protein
MRETNDVAHVGAFDHTGPEGHLKGNLIGEVYAVSPETMLDIDVYYENGVCYNRFQRQFFLADQETPFKPKDGTNIIGIAQKCWVYLANPTFWDSRATRLRAKLYNNRFHKQVWTV